MRLDSAQFPLVRMYPDEHDADGAFDEFDRILARRQPCVMVSVGGEAEHEHEHEHAPEERKRLTLWLKRNKPALQAYVKGIIQVEPSAARRLALKAFMVMMSKVWGCPMFVVASEPAALDLAHQLLAGQALPELAE